MRKNSLGQRYRLPLSIAVVAAAGLTASKVLADTNIVVNGGFETGSGSTVPGWNIFDPNTQIDTTLPHTGAQDLYFNNTNAAGFASYAYQDTPVGSATPGTTYTFSFYAAGNFANGGVGQYDVLFFGSTGQQLQDNGIQVFFPGSTYQQYPAAGNNTFVAPASASYAEIKYYSATGAIAGSSAQLHLDDVSLTSAGGSTGGGGTGNNSTGVSAWNMSGAGDWNVSTNWTAGVPNGVGAEADLFTGITASHTIYSDTAITVGTINFNNPNTYVIAGAGSLTMQTSTGSATVIVQQGTQKISIPWTIASNTTLNVSSGSTLLISNPVTINAGESLSAIGAGTVTYQAPVSLGMGATLALASSSYIPSLLLATNSTVSVAGSSSTHRLLLQSNSLSIAGGSTIDLANNDLIVYGGDLGNISGLIQSGYNNGAWNGTGLASSAAANDSRHLTALGVIPNNNGSGIPLYGSGAALGQFDGTSPALNDVLVRYTYTGDSNLDGKVDGSDYSRIDNGYLNHLSGWLNGDFNYDGVVNGSDYTLIDNAFNTQGAPIAAASVQVASQIAAVPEPGSLMLMVLSTATLLRRRRKATCGGLS